MLRVHGFVSRDSLSWTGCCEVERGKRLQKSKETQGLRSCQHEAFGDGYRCVLRLAHRFIESAPCAHNSPLTRPCCFRRHETLEDVLHFVPVVFDELIDKRRRLFSSRMRSRSQEAMFLCTRAGPSTNDTDTFSPDGQFLHCVTHDNSPACTSCIRTAGQLSKNLGFLYRGYEPWSFGNVTST